MPRHRHHRQNASSKSEYHSHITRFHIYHLNVVYEIETLFRPFVNLNLERTCAKIGPDTKALSAS